MLDAINRYRATAARSAEVPRLPVLTLDSRLSAVARRHNEVMRTQIDRLGFAAGTTHWGDLGERLRAAGVAFRWAGENVAAGMNTSAPALFERLQQSPTHNANLLAPQPRRVGLSVLRQGDCVYITQIFVE